MVSKKNIVLVALSILPSLVFASQISKADMFKNGKDIYEATCISCHGKNGETNAEMHLVVKPRKLNKTILTHDESFKIIKEGAHYFGAHSDIMPAFKYVYSDSELNNVALYINETFNSKRDEKVSKLIAESDTILKKDESKMLKVGEKIFKRNCSLCHGINGDAKSDYVEQSKKSQNFIYPYNLTRTLLNENQIFLYAKFGGKFWGTDKNDMPSWKKKYNDFKLKSVAKYVNEKIKKIK